MSGEAHSDLQRADAIRCALATEVHELGLAVIVLGASRRVVLNGSVATRERRAQVGAIAQRLLPEFEIQNRVGVILMNAPFREDLP
jgi:hypothetical protein